MGKNDKHEPRTTTELQVFDFGQGHKEYGGPRMFVTEKPTHLHFNFKNEKFQHTYKEYMNL